MSAETLRCPGCGAPTTSDAHSCTHCGVRLATVGCPSCFGMMYVGSRHCPHCGARAARAAGDAAAEEMACPRCGVPLEATRVGEVPLHDCARCGGLWLSSDAFQEVTASRETQAAVLAFAPRTPGDVPEGAVRYAPCPCCGTIMNRVNFARISGVVLDTCKQHGTWFDRDELRKVIEFIRAGGLEASREREKMKLEDERRRLEQLERGLPGLPPEAGAPSRAGGDDALRYVLRFLGL
jgi:Zn-finger nucleic acid-binding protein